MKFSIVIPVKEINNYVRENIGHILQQSHRDWELVVVTNDLEQSEWADERVKTIPSGRVGPADKRDIGADKTDGDIIVFLDDDSYPNSDYLQRLEELYGDERVKAVGGPGVTPEQDSFQQKVSGAIFLSRLTGGVPERYIPFGRPRMVDDWPSVNLSVRREVFLEVGGYNCKVWPGEDTYFCRKLSEVGVAVRYEPTLSVWHHRREGIRRHLNQVGRYGEHRGYFARRYPSNSRRLQYFAPTALVALTIGALIGPVLPTPVNQVIRVTLMLYLVIQIFGLFQIGRRSSAGIAIAAIPYVILSHLWYGSCFFRGFTRTSPPQMKLR